MYEHYEPEKHVFVDREHHLAWMDDALKLCKEKSVVLHLHGIGGIGKSSLLDHWDNTIEPSIRLDCQQYTQFYDRLNVLAKEAVLLGIKLRRFDILWQIRQRFVEGVEPAKEKGREWAKEVLMAIPFIGSLTSIGSAISAIGQKVTPKLRAKYGDVGDWLQSRLGKNHMEKFLEVLWKNPRQAEFLYLDALREDLDCRKKVDEPLLILLDHFEYVDCDKQLWRYRKRMITESELWDVFLSLISNTVGVVAGRYSASPQTRKELDIQEVELTEFDTESCVELLNRQGIIDAELQKKIVSVSGGNPFVIKTMCDMCESGGLSSEDVENLRANTLEEVRLKTWRRLFSQAHDLLGLVDRAGFLPFFNRRIMDIVAPEMKTDQWNRLIRLSFVRERGDGTWVLHDLAKELVLAELGKKLEHLTNDVADSLEKIAIKESDFILLGMSISVTALASPDNAIRKLENEVMKILNTPVYSEFYELLSVVEIDTEKGKLAIQTYKAWNLLTLLRYAEAEQLILETLEYAQQLAEKNPDAFSIFVAHNLVNYGTLCSATDRLLKSEELLRESINLYKQRHDLIIASQGYISLCWQWAAFWYLGMLLRTKYRLKEAEEVLQEALILSRELPKSAPDSRWTQYHLSNQIRSALAAIQIDTGRPLEAEKICREIIGMPNFKEADGIFKRTIYFQLYRSLRLTNRPYEAEEFQQKRLDISREFFKNESIWWPNYCGTLIYHSILLKQTGRYSEAEKLLSESLRISRKFSTKDYVYLVARSLDILAALFRETGRYSEAETTIRESIDIWMDYVNFDVYDPDRIWFAVTLNNQAMILRQISKYTEAEDVYQKALEILREYTNLFPEAILLVDLLTVILNNLGVLYRITGNLEDAQKILGEALELKKTLVEKSPEMFIHRVAASLNNFGVLLVEIGELSKAESVFEEALNQHRDLAEKLPVFYLPRVAMTLNNLGIFLKREKRLEEAEKAYREAIEIYEEFALKTPRVYERDLVKTLGNYIILLSELAYTDEKSKQVMTRLKDLGVEKEPEKEKWLEEEEISYIY